MSHRLNHTEKETGELHKKVLFRNYWRKVWAAAAARERCNFCSSKTFKSVELATKLINEFAFDDVATAMKRAVVYL